MKRMFIAVRLISVYALLALAVGCTSTSTSTPTQSVPDMLIASGFQARTPTTMQRAKLQSLTGGQISEIQAYEKTFYVYPDFPNNRVLVGGPTQYQAYQNLRQSRNLPAESVPQLYRGPSFDWRKWYNGA
jgi:hypothetical protein